MYLFPLKSRGFIVILTIVILRKVMVFFITGMTKFCSMGCCFAWGGWWWRKVKICHCGGPTGWLWRRCCTPVLWSFCTTGFIGLFITIFYTLAIILTIIPPLLRSLLPVNVFSFFFLFSHVHLPIFLNVRIEIQIHDFKHEIVNVLIRWIRQINVTWPFLFLDMILVSVPTMSPLDNSSISFFSQVFFFLLFKIIWYFLVFFP